MLISSLEHLQSVLGHIPPQSANVHFPIELSPMEIGELRANPMISVGELHYKPTPLRNPLQEFPFEDEHRLQGPLAGYGDSDRAPPQPFPWGGSPNSGSRQGGGMIPNMGGSQGSPLGTKPRFDPPMGPFGGPGPF